MRSFFFASLAIVGLALCTVSALPTIDTNAWWVRLTDFPRLQISIALLLVAVALVAFIKRRPKATGLLLGLIALALGYHVAVLAPYLPAGSDFERADCAPDDRLSIMVANVKFHNNPSGKLVAMVQRHQPDVFLAMETNQQWDKALAPLAQRMPHAISHITGSYFSIHLFSRLPLVSPEIRFLAGQQTPQIVTGLKLRNGETIDFLGIHPRPPLPSQSALGRDAVLLKTGLLLRDRERPGLVAGDFNAVPWERATALMQRIARLIDPRVGYGYVPTYDAKSWWMSWPLDHIFHETGFATVSLTRGDAFGSDHYPFMAQLCRVPPERSEAPPEPSQTDLDEARRIIQQAIEQARTSSAR